jgi:pantothenate kinase type III
VAIPTLSLDLGNTAVKWRLRVGRTVRQGRVLHGKTAVADLMADAFRHTQPSRLVDRYSNWSLAYSAVAHPTKVDAILGPLERCLETRGHGLRPERRLVLGTSSGAFTVVCGYRKPAELGADRWAAIVGLVQHAHRLADKAEAAQTQMSLWLVSAGTATVVDLVDVCWDGEASAPGSLATFSFRGGAILPGIGLTQQALAAATGALADYMPGVGQPLRPLRLRGVPQGAREAIVYGLAAAQSSSLLTLPWPTGVVVHGGYGNDWLRYFRSVLRAYAPLSGRISGPLPFFVKAPDLVLDGVEQWSKARRSLG